MPSTYTLISSNVLSSTASSVTFSGIPQTYTDLVLRVSSRSDGVTIQDYPEVYVNGVTSSYSRTTINNGGTTVTSFRNTNRSGFQFYSNAANSTSGTFTSLEMYFPNYTSSINKIAGMYGIQENNSTTNNQYAGYLTAGLTNATAAISSLTIINYNYNFVAGSSFYLYGISKS